MVRIVGGVGRAWTALAVCAALSACGGGGGGSGGSTGTSTPTTPPASTIVVSDTDAARLAKQATFGPTADIVASIKSAGISGWLDQQFAATGSSYSDIAASAVLANYCVNDATCTRHNFSREPVAMRFYADALSKPDQLRQRVAFALSQLMVASTVEVNNSAGLASLNEIFLTKAFGNFRDILMAVTLNGTMGDYLDMADSNKSAPSENYAREMLQLFSIGPDQLNMDGTPIKDSTGATIPTYSQDDVHGVARALTGWTYARLNGAAITDNNARDYSQPMITVPARYDTTAKSFLGVTVPAGATQADSVGMAVDAAFNNASTAPYVSKFLIQQLVTSNPSAAYVRRVASTFVNNGSNVRGDMRAVVRAVLTDAEARGNAAPSDNYGKVKEPVLLLTSIARAVGMTSDGYVFTQRDAPLGEAAFSSPSVFNFYPPDYPLPGSTTLVSPPSKLLTTNSIVQRHNNVYDWTVSGLSTRSEFQVNSSVIGSTGTTIDWSGWTGLDIDQQIDRIDLIMLARTMTTAQKTALKNAATAITNADATVQARLRAQMMIYIVGASPLFQVDR